ncbi:MAG: cohesin domain-containing protein [Methanophagales archaeon]|nr:cohesin domain-containing protein [Methanophagales archaeon]
MRIATTALMLIILITLIIASSVHTEPVTVVIVSPVEGTVRSGETLNVKIIVIPNKPIKGIKLELHFDPSLFYPKVIREGELFPESKASFASIIEHDKVTITGFFNDDQRVTSRGVFAYVTLIANSTNFGTSVLRLSDVEVTGDGEELPFITVDGRIRVIPTSFVTTLSSCSYPSIPGVHEGTITPSVTINNISRLFTYPCPGTCGHSEEITLWNDTWNITARRDKSESDWHVIEFPHSFSLIANHTYHYSIRTGSYPLIIHRHTFTNSYGTINCTSFRDVNGNVYDDWIPAIKLEG